MTKEEAVKDYQYDVSICLSDNGKWFWDINGGYCSVGSHDYFETPNDALVELEKYLETMEPFEK